MEHHAEAVRRGVLAGVAAYGIWGVFPLYFTALDGVAPTEVLAHRILWSLLTVAALLALLGDRSWWRRLRATPGATRLTAATGALIALNWLAYIWAVDRERVLEAALGYYISPLVAVAVGVVAFGEGLRRAQWAAVGLGTAAVVVLTVAAGRPPWISLALAGTFTAYAIGKRRSPLDPLASLAAETAFLVPVAVLILSVAAIGGHLAFGADGASTTALLVMAGPVTAAPLAGFAAAARRVPLSILGLVQYLTPTLQFLCAVVVLGEPLPAARWVGFVLVWGALALLSADALVRSRRRPVPG